MGKATVSAERQRVFESLYAKHRLEVLAYCTRRIGAAEAPDACSETFLVAWRRIDDIPEPPKTLPYLYGVASKVLSNNFRALHRRSRLEALLGVLGVAPSPDPSVLVIQNSRDEEILAAVRRLKPRDREIVMLYTWEELSRETIAEIMGLTRAAIDQRIHRSYQHLARVLAPMIKSNPIKPPPIAKQGGT
jgi:RNA polymerase sigma-70 factor (ECF subfamily)